MKKFSKITSEKVEKEEEFVYDGEYLKIKERDGWQFVTESDCVIGLVHLLDFDEIILRKEWIPPYQDREPSSEYFLTMLSGTIEEDEKPIDTLKRELEEEAGIRLNTLYSSEEYLGEYFMTKGNSAKYHIYYIPLWTNEFQKIQAVGDGSDAEEKSSTIRVNTAYLSTLKPSDIITAYCLEKIKEKITENYEGF
jgi:8-oxo-dGTP pyrophosphatase MutT (NUDIX family)